MANNTKLSSWTTLRDYLARNIDPNKDWDNEDLRGYDVLNQAYTSGKLSADQFAEGKTALGQYLADVDADRNYRAATAKAENDARVETAQQDYLHTRLAGYLPQLQAGAGQTGYQGLTGGQAVALRNDMAQKQADIGARKQTALGGYLQTYQGALRDNSAAATDQYTSIAAARETKAREDSANGDTALSEMLFGINGEGVLIGTDSKISAEDNAALMGYLDSINANDATKNKWRVILDSMTREGANKGASGSGGGSGTVEPVDPPVQHQVNLDNVTNTKQLSNEKTAIKNDLTKGKLTEEQAEDLTSKARDKEKTMLVSSKSSGLISAGSTITIKFATTDNTFVNNNTTVTLGGKIDTPAGAADFGEGQVFLYNNTVYVKKGDKSFKVVDHVGNGPYEKLKNHYAGTYYDLSATPTSVTTSVPKGTKTTTSTALENLLSAMRTNATMMTK